MRVKRIVFINRAPFGNTDLDFSDKKVISLTGINGSGKTTIISYIVDAFYEIAKEVFYNEFSGLKQDKFYRVISPLYNTIGNDFSLVYVLFDDDGKDITYFDFEGISSEDIFNKVMTALYKNKDASTWPIKYSEISFKLKNAHGNMKYVSVNKDNAEIIFRNNILTYFPSYRYEQPGYLNDVYQMKLSYKCTSDFSGDLINPIEVATDLPEIANWIMDVAVDSHLSDKGTGDVLISILNLIVNVIFCNKCRQQASIGIGPRNSGGERLQIINTSTGEMIYPSIFNISSGEASLLCIFVELIKQADKIERNKNDVGGIVLIDEVDKHLHIKLQKEVLPVLIKIFPNIQFIFLHIHLLLTWVYMMNWEILVVL